MKNTLAKENLDLSRFPELQRVKGIRLKVDDETNDIHMICLDESDAPFAEFVVDINICGAVVMHLEAARDKALGLIPTNAIH